MMNSVGTNNVSNIPLGQHNQRNQAAAFPGRERELWRQVLGMGSQSDCELNKVEAECSFQDNKRVSANNPSESTTTKEETPQSFIFVNAQGERILAIKSAFGVKYLKIGEVPDDPMLVDSKPEMPKQTIGQYVQMLSTQ